MSLFSILNLFSKDIYVVDQILARVIQQLCRTLAVCMSIIVVIGYSFPLFILFVFPLGWFYLRVMRYFRSSLLGKFCSDFVQVLSRYVKGAQTSRCCLSISNFCMVFGVFSRIFNY